MPTRDFSDAVIETDPDGFLADESVWTPEVAETLAREAGIPALTERHWKVLALCREDAARLGCPPDAVRISELSGFTAEELEHLFPEDPCRLAARIAGLRVPSSNPTVRDPKQETE